MPVSEAEYRKLLEREEGRKAGPQTSRDDAVRRANIAAGYGNSTALRKFGSTSPFKIAGGSGGGGGKRGGGKSAGGGAGGKGGAGPSPKRDPSLMWESPPPNASPVRDPSLMWQGATAGGASPPRDPSLMWQGATAGAGAPPIYEPSGSMVGPFLGRPGEGGTGFPAAPGGGGFQIDRVGDDIPVPTPRPSPFVNDLVRPGGPSNPHVLPMDAALKRMGDENYKSPSQVWQWLFGNMGGRPGGGWG